MWLLILTGVASVALVAPVVVHGASERLRVQVHDGLRASVRALGIDRYTSWADVSVLPRFDGVLLQQVALGAEDGRPLLTLPVATCRDVTLAEGFLNHIDCEGDDATLDLDALAATAGVASLSRARLGQRPADVDIGWAVDDRARTLSLSSRVGMRGVAGLHCDLFVDGVDLAALRELHASRASFGEVGLLWNPVGWVQAMKDASGATVRALQDVALRDAGCGITDDGLRDALRANPELAMYVAGSARFAVASFDPHGGDAITRFMDQGGTLRVGTKATAPVPLFAPGTVPGPAAGDHGHRGRCMMVWRVLSGTVLALLVASAYALRHDEDAGLWWLLFAGTAALTLPLLRARPVPRWGAVACTVGAGQLLVVTTMIPHAPPVQDLIGITGDELWPRKVLTGGIVGLWALAVALGRPHADADAT